MKHCLIATILALCLGLTSDAISKGGTNTEPLISIEIESSRSQLVAGEGLGVIARIKNISESTVYIRESELALTLPLELEGSRAEVTGYAAYFPTEHHEGGQNVPYEKFFSNVIKLNPGDSYSAFWTNTFSSKTTSNLKYVWHQITSQFQFLFFFPGKYSITVTAKYWNDPGFPVDGYRTMTKSVTLPVIAPLFVILLGAALGGLIAHVIFPKKIPVKTRTLTFFTKILTQLAGIFGSALLSVIVTIVLSRVSETQFLISVTVSDFWGAIVTGFVANYLGYKVLEKIVPGANASEHLNVTSKEN